MSPLELTLPTAPATQELGQALARSLPQLPDAGLVVYLEGDLGAGKSTLARSLLRACGVTGTIRSPTYTLIESYEAQGVRFVHGDLYRLRGAGEVEELGLRELLPQALTLLEWPERGGSAVPVADLRLQLTYSGEGRCARLVPCNATATDWVSKLRFDRRLQPYLSNLT
jgi:tRNA threonylcarbamoyladenosine biosynthesis protein TsaE